MCVGVFRCGGDDSTSFVWDSLRELDLSSNHISQLGDSLVSCACDDPLPDTHSCLI